MATPNAAHKGVVKVGLTAPPATIVLKGINAVTFPRDREVIEVTDFTLDDRRKFLGIKSGTLTLAGFRDKGDAGQAILDAAFDSGADVYVRLELVSATDGFEVTTKVAGIDIAPAIDGIVPITYSLEITTDASGVSVTALS